MDVYWLIASAVSFVATVFFALAEGAVYHYSPAKLEDRIKLSRTAERVRRRLNRTDSYQAIAQVGAASSAIVLALVLAHAYPDRTIESFLLLLASTVGIAVGAGMIVPREIARHSPETLLLLILPLFAALDRIVAPLEAMIAPSRRAARRLFGLEQGLTKEEQVEDEILSAVHEGEREGVIEEGEKQMIEGIIDLKEEDVADIMTPRTEMFSISIDTPLPEVIAKVNEVGHSRIPVFDQNRDNILGILHVKDLLKFTDSQKAMEQRLSGILRTPVFVPESKKISDLLQQFRRDRVHLAIVVDEYGGTAGIITIEDIIEEIVGEIEDEFDTESPAESISLTDDGKAVVDARIHMAELNEKLSLSLPEDEGFDTIGGFVCSLAGHVPEQKEQVTHQEILFTVLSADDRRILSLEVTLPPPPDE